MNDEQFEVVLDFIRRNWNSGGSPVSDLRARDTAQREALANMEKELKYERQIQAAMASDQKAVAEALGIPPDEHSGGAGEQLLAIARLRQERDIAQAQLAEAVGLLRAVDENLWPDWDETGLQTALMDKVQAFLTGQAQGAEVTGNSRLPAQAEQQEARCEYCDGTGDVHSIDGEWRGTCKCPAGQAPQRAQAGDEEAQCQQAAMAAGLIAVSHGIRSESNQYPTFKAGWKARAALATQPAAAPMPAEISRQLMGKIVDEVFDGGIEDSTVIADIYRVIARECSPAVRGAEHDQ